MVIRTIKHVVVVVFILAFFVLASSSMLIAYSSGPPNFRTGAPGESTCNTSGCHSGNSTNAPGGSLTVSGLENGYVPGTTYSITVELNKSGQSRWGFEATIQNAGGVSVGTLIVTELSRTQINDNYIKHTSSGTQASTWTFDWQAPAESVGDITIYVAGNAANGNNNPSGDFIYTSSQTASPVVSSIIVEPILTNRFKLHSNFPNPFNPSTTIQFSVSKPGLAIVSVFDLAGKLVKTLTQNNYNVGMHTIVWDGKNQSGVSAASGVYLARLRQGDQQDMIKMQLIK